jgi:hypothetical protein
MMMEFPHEKEEEGKEYLYVGRSLMGTQQPFTLLPSQRSGPITHTQYANYHATLACIH